MNDDKRKVTNTTTPPATASSASPAVAPTRSDGFNDVDEGGGSIIKGSKIKEN